MRTDQSVRNLIKGGLRPLSDVPQRDVERACDRVLERLQEQPQATAPQTGRWGALDVRSHRRGAWKWAAAAAVFVMAATATATLWRSSADLFHVVEGDVRQGPAISSDGNAGAVLELVDGSRVEMRSHSELSLERAADGLRIRLSNGGIIVNAAKQRSGHLYVQTNDVTVSVVGTVFLVSAEEKGSRVAVIEGEVRVQQGALDRQVLPGEQVATHPLEWQPMSEEIGWSRNATAHIALLQKNTPAAGKESAQPREAFEVVSVRPTATPSGSGGRGGGGGPRRNPRPLEDACGSDREPLIDPRRFDASNTTVVQLVIWAYGLDCVPGAASELLFGAAEWARTEGFDVVATIPEGTPSYTRDQLWSHDAPALQAMLRTMLAERFNLMVHREAKEMSIYVLGVAPGGPRYIAPSTFKYPEPVIMPEGRVFVPAGFGDPNPQRGMSVWREGDGGSYYQSVGPGHVSGRKKSMAWLARRLAR